MIAWLMNMGFAGGGSAPAPTVKYYAAWQSSVIHAGNYLWLFWVLR